MQCKYQIFNKVMITEKQTTLCSKERVIYWLSFL